MSEFYIKNYMGESVKIAKDSDKEDKGKITINGTEYEVRTSTTDAGQAGYITFVVEQ